MAENGFGAFQRAKLSPLDTQIDTFSGFFLPQIKLNTGKTCLKRPLKKKTKIGFQDQSSLNAGQKYCRMFQGEHSAILLTFIKLPFVIKIIFMSIFEWSFKTGSTVTKTLYLQCQVIRTCVFAYT